MGSAMVTHDANANGERTGRLFASPFLGFVAGALGAAACACGFYSLVVEAQPARSMSVPLAIVGVVCAIIYIVSFRRQFTKHHRARTVASGRSQNREITAASWALVIACIGLCLSLLAVSWLFL